MVRSARVEGGKFLLHISQSREPGRAPWSWEKRPQCHMPNEKVRQAIEGGAKSRDTHSQLSGASRSYPSLPEAKATQHEDS